MSSELLSQAVDRYATRFGDVEVGPRQRWVAAEPLAGFEDLRDFVLLQVQGQGPFLWLQSLQLPELAFLIIDAACFSLAYADVPEASACCVLVILPRSAGEVLRLHKQAPLLFDAERGTFAQKMVEAEQVLGSGVWVEQPADGRPYRELLGRVIKLPAA